MLFGFVEIVVVTALQLVVFQHLEEEDEEEEECSPYREEGGNLRSI
ncbi:hypothetical protein A2U01_0066354, partial [Trifolium medium]|nr:hypothetical protein [Trifolium medium]